MIPIEKRPKNGAEKKNRKFPTSGGVTSKVSAQYTVVTLGQGLPDSVKKGISSSDSLKLLRSVKEVRGIRESKDGTTNFWDIQIEKEISSKRDLLREGLMALNLRENRGVTRMREVLQRQDCHSSVKIEKKTKVPQTLEPIGKAVIYDDFEGFDLGNGRFKTKTSIKHPGFGKKGDDDAVIKEAIIPKHVLVTMKDMMTPPKMWQGVSGIDNWKNKVDILQEDLKNSHAKYLNELTMKDLYRSRKEDSMICSSDLNQNVRIKRREPSFFNESSSGVLREPTFKKPLPAISTPRGLPWSEANSPAKGDSFGMKKLSAIQPVSLKNL